MTFIVRRYLPFVYNGVSIGMVFSRGFKLNEEVSEPRSVEGILAQAVSCTPRGSNAYTRSRFIASQISSRKKPKLVVLSEILEVCIGTTITGEISLHSISTHAD